MEFHGLLVLEKPAHITSRAVVDRALRWFPRGTSVGHTGTLDPLATGVLVVCVGKATRLAEYVQALPKTYRARIQLGATSDTDDADGTITPNPNVVLPTLAQIDEARRHFLGTISQVPPAHSAVHVNGVRAYKLARAGKETSLSPRSVTIYRIDILDFESAKLDVVVHCSKGTYIRSLARDLGAMLCCGGFIETLRRTRVGPFDESQALPMTMEPTEAREKLLPIENAVVAMPRIDLPLDQAQRLAHGQLLTWDGDTPTGLVGVFDENERFIAVALWEPLTRSLKAEKVFVV